MKRRAFIVACLVSLGMGIFSIVRWLRKPVKGTALAQPKFLSHLCDNQTIQMLGQAYLKLKPDETSDEVLWNDLLTGPPDNLLTGKKDISIYELQIEERIKRDFNNENIVVVQGWVLSITEARQCAIFSIITA